MSEPKLSAEEIAQRALGDHYHCEGDGWYCCGACLDSDGNPCCLDDSRLGRCDCRMKERRSELAGMILAAESAARAEAFEEAARIVEVPPISDTILCGDTCDYLAAVIRARGREGK